MRGCNGSSACEHACKQQTERSMMHSRFCPVASGDTPTTGRLYDAIACGCIPIIISDDIQLPFPTSKPIPALGFGVRLSEKFFLGDPVAAIRTIIEMDSTHLRTLQGSILHARRFLSYRSPGSLVASLVLREAFMTCLQMRSSNARPPSKLQKC